MRILTVYAHPNPKSFCHAILQKFTKGLEDAGHVSEVVDLYAIRFDPVFRTQDFASYVHESIPLDILEQMNLKERVLESAGGPIQRFIASRWLRNKDTVAVAKFIHAHRPKDVIAQWEKLNNAQGLARGLGTASGVAGLASRTLFSYQEPNKYNTSHARIPLTKVLKFGAA